jgi:hypothetical protein
MPLKSNRGIAVGVAWFDRAQWTRLTEVVPDRSKLDDTFEDWERNARNALARITSEGHRAREVSIDVENLLAWCTLRGVPPDSAARAEYVAELMRLNGDG